MVQLLLLAIVSCCNLRAAISGWVDPDSPHSSKNTKSYIDNRQYELVFSDEFNTDNRIFHDGADPRWTAINKDDYTNYALHYYNASLVNTTGGYLNINTILKDVTFVADDSNPHSPKKTKVFQSGMIQGWNKFCFTGGIVEIRMKLPGRHDIGGLWPAMWLLGNLARATYVGSSNNVWPWSYDTCNKKIQHQQQFSACNRMNHFNMQPYHGRGAPEIDILEAMPGSEKLKSTPINRPYYSASFQVAPGIEGYRPNVGEKPVRKLWYNKGIEYGKNASENIFFWGMHLDGNSKAESYLADAISANRNIGSEHFDHFHTYRFEWKTGRTDGYLEWCVEFLDCIGYYLHL